MSISAAQCRAARALLAWSQGDLCAAADVGRATLANFELEKSTPYGRTLRDVRAALELAGVTFLDAGGVASGPGVSLHKPNGAAIDIDENEMVQYRENLENDAPPGAGG